MTSRNPDGRPLGETCLHGHDMSIHRRRRRNGETYCRECKRVRAQQANRRISYVTQMERLLRDGLGVTSGTFRDWQLRVWKFFEAVEAREEQQKRGAA